ncbi:MAG: thiamine phosphate synthase [bacterium]|nr:thiamine phosphate synthase [Betaproteobacteria bacterium]
MTLRLPGLYAVTPDGLPEAELLARVEQSLAAGVRLLQYRAKPAGAAGRAADGSARPGEAVARAIAAACRAAGAWLIVNDDPRLAAALGAHGVHLGRDDGTVAQAREHVGPALVGVSCYDSLDRAVQAEAEGADYVAFGAMFPSRVKPGAVRASPALLAQARARLRVPVVAIGGIDLGNAAGVLRAGAHSLAVISAVYSAPDIGDAVRRFKEIIETETRSPPAADAAGSDQP